MNGKLVAIATKDNDLYKMSSQVTLDKTIEVNNSVVGDKEKWHRKLGHVNFKYLNMLSRHQLVEGITPNLDSEYMKCKTCIQNKMHNVRFENNRRKAEDILEIVHTDLNGPHQTKGINGEQYFLTFIDDYSKLIQIYVIKTKDEVYECFVSYINLVENISGKK